MKNYTITVNGKAYAVTVEEGAVSGSTCTRSTSRNSRFRQRIRTHARQGSGC